MEFQNKGNWYFSTVQTGKEFDGINRFLGFLAEMHTFMQCNFTKRQLFKLLSTGVTLQKTMLHLFKQYFEYKALTLTKMSRCLTYINLMIDVLHKLNISNGTWIKQLKLPRANVCQMFRYKKSDPIDTSPAVLYYPFHFTTTLQADPFCKMVFLLCIRTPSPSALGSNGLEKFSH